MRDGESDATKSIKLTWSMSTSLKNKNNNLLKNILSIALLFNLKPGAV